MLYSSPTGKAIKGQLTLEGVSFSASSYAHALTSILLVNLMYCRASTLLSSCDGAPYCFLCLDGHVHSLQACSTAEFRGVCLFLFSSLLHSVHSTFRVHWLCARSSLVPGAC